jgi:arsenate reductase
MTRLHGHIAVEKLDDSAAERITTYAAGSHPQGAVHPLAIATLQSMNLPVDRLRSKSWQEFAQAGSPPLDFVFTVCDDAAGAG